MSDATFPFDHAGFLNSLPQVGQPLEADLPILRRGGLPDGACDALGPLPYSQRLADAAPGSLRNRLQDHRLITFLTLLKPGTVVDRAAWEAAGFEVGPAAPHFVWEPGFRPLTHSAKTRHNVRRARHHWQVRELEIARHAEAMGALYSRLYARREMSAVLNYPRSHFELLAAVPGIEALGAFDAEGLGAFLLYARWRREVHCLHLAGAERSYRTGAAYALYQELWDREHAATTLYLGGAPRAVNGAGITKFKQRFSNTTRSPVMVRAVLDPAACRSLQEQRGCHAWFPPYRSQHGD